MPRNAGRIGKKWSQHVTRTSDALDLESGVFEGDDPREIAKSLKRSAERSRRRKSSPYRSAMSMLVFYINRAGKNLPKAPARDPRTREGVLARRIRALAPAACNTTERTS